MGNYSSVVMALPEADQTHVYFCQFSPAFRIRVNDTISQRAENFGVGKRTQWKEPADVCVY